ncbi:alpha-tocopherol transfer protein-like isoform X1 [Gigantopelta aegis]|nr:alpha-tocopherol transfer protein-like isoform X1 [Gigantopelta aegis]
MASSSGYKCTLSPELLKKAKKELSEDPNTTRQEIKALRERLERIPGLKARTDDAFILRFLRARKFDQEKAFTLVMNFYKIKFEHADMFATMKPSYVKEALEDGVTGMLEHRDKEGCKVIMFRPGRWNTDKYDVWDMFKTNYMSLAKVIQEEETQIHGLRMFLDLSNLTWTHAKQITPTYAKCITGLFQESFPSRFKGIHYIHEPAFFDYVFSLLKPLLKKKIIKRIHFHGPRVEELREYVDEEYLPEEYGGKAPPFSNKSWADMLLNCEAEFEEDMKYGMVDMTLKTSTKGKVDATDSLPGSFKKLNVD